MKTEQIRFKFRVWDPENKKFIFSTPENLNSSLLRLNGMYCDLRLGSGQSDYIVQQYVGLVDINNKEVYEGDIIKFSVNQGESDTEEYIGEVFWDHEFAAFSFDRKLGFTLLDPVIQETIEIISHIFYDESEKIFQG
jgi:uncharacterized phage protein (TIGR01671 family)